MRFLLVLLVLGAIAVAGCGSKQPSFPRACLDGGRATFARALEAAPGPVRVDGTTTISQCLERVRNDADLQTLGVLLFGVAEELAGRARARGDVAAAERLGYLAGAARKGADRSSGVGADLARRIEVAAGGALRGGPRVHAAVQRGLAAGVAQG